MRRACLPPLLAWALLGASGCDPLQAVVGAAGVTVKHQVRVFGPAGQLAVVGQNGAAYRLAARSDESGVPGASVGFGLGRAAVTDGTGRATLQLAPNTVHRLTVSYKLKGGAAVSLTAAGVTGATDGAEDLDAANVLVAVAAFDAGKASSPLAMRAAITAMRSAVAGASKLPALTDEASARRAFESLADPAVRKALGL
jgi:hypothetical protein